MGNVSEGESTIAGFTTEHVWVLAKKVSLSALIEHPIQVIENGKICEEFGAS
jgi:hypothetical protein